MFKRFQKYFSVINHFLTAFDALQSVDRAAAADENAACSWKDYTTRATLAFIRLAAGHASVTNRSRY